MARWLLGACAFALMAVWAAPAQAITYTQTTRYTTNTVSELTGVAVDGSGDVFVTDTINSPGDTIPVAELPAEGTPFALPFTGLSDPIGVAVDGGVTCSSPTPETTGWWSCPRGARSSR